MNKHLPAIFAGMFAGILASFMMRLNASLGAHIGPLESSFVVHLVGFLFGLLLVLPFCRRATWRRIQGAPLYLFGLGGAGMLVVIGSNVTVAKMGMVPAVGLFITGNLLFGLSADHFGWIGLQRRRLNARRVLGLCAALAGLALIL